MPFSRIDVSVSRRPKGYPEQPKTIGERLLKFRIDNKLRRMDVARQIGIAPGMITDWENGRYQPSDTNVKKIIDLIKYIPLEDS